MEQELSVDKEFFCRAGHGDLSRVGGYLQRSFFFGALAFRGGTAIHKLHFSPQVRYSEDIDLVQVEPGPVKPITERLSEVLSWLPRRTTEMRRFGFRMKFRYDSELAPIEPMRLKVEVNTYEHFSVLPLI